jgi:hypothetical protein
MLEPYRPEAFGYAVLAAGPAAAGGGLRAAIVRKRASFGIMEVIS